LAVPQGAVEGARGTQRRDESSVIKTVFVQIISASGADYLLGATAGENQAGNDVMQASFV
jgi:hypothetical protein